MQYTLYIYIYMRIHTLLCIYIYIHWYIIHDRHDRHDIWYMTFDIWYIFIYTDDMCVDIHIQSYWIIHSILCFPHLSTIFTHSWKADYWLPLYIYLRLGWNHQNHGIPEFDPRCMGQTFHLPANQMMFTKGNKADFEDIIHMWNMILSVTFI